MTNEMGADPKNVFSCFALKDSYLFSASGGRISIFSIETFETLVTFSNPPLTATYFIFLSQNLFAIGFDDSSILIHCPYTKKLWVWDANGWKKLCSKFLHCFQTGLAPETCDHIQFRPDQIHLISFHEGQIDVYEAPTRNHISQELLHSSQLYPFAIAAHPSEPNQIALGLTDGRVHVLEPLQS